MVELILFITLMAMMSGTILPLLFNSTESRQRQDAIALVEQNGAQILQLLSKEVRHGERILYPPMGGTGRILAIQTADADTNPTVIGVDSGSLVMVQGRSRRILNSSLVGITHFTVDNTSSGENRNSVAVALGVRRVIRLHQPLTYSADFDAVFNVNPHDEFSGDDCGCITPYCDSSGSGTFVWQVCINGDTCIPYTEFVCEIED